MLVLHFTAASTFVCLKMSVIKHFLKNMMKSFKKLDENSSCIRSFFFTLLCQFFWSVAPLIRMLKQKKSNYFNINATRKIKVKK